MTSVVFWSAQILSHQLDETDSVKLNHIHPSAVNLSSPHGHGSVLDLLPAGLLISHKVVNFG